MLKSVSWCHSWSSCQDILQLPHVAVVNPQINSILSTYLETFEVIHSSPPIETQEGKRRKGTVWERR